MTRYIIRRLLLMIPTLWAIITLNFFIVQIAPGGPVDQAVASLSGLGAGPAMEQISGAGKKEVGSTEGAQQGKEK
ncbi:MAG TPA: microcin ABC transporter permease, partial [Rectinemataceae bacterium]|nr:microcin ABC transporter permease [Rectinemataceae bacterium]